MNWDKIYTLLHIAERTAQWPALTRLHQAVMKELGEHIKDLEPEPAPAPPPPEPEPEQAAPSASSIKRRFGADETSEDRKE